MNSYHFLSTIFIMGLGAIGASQAWTTMAIPTQPMELYQRDTCLETSRQWVNGQEVDFSIPEEFQGIPNPAVGVFDNVLQVGVAEAMGGITRLGGVVITDRDIGVYDNFDHNLEYLFSQYSNTACDNQGFENYSRLIITKNQPGDVAGCFQGRVVCDQDIIDMHVVFAAEANIK